MSFKILTNLLDKLPSSKKYNNIKIIEAMDLKDDKKLKDLNEHNAQANN